MRPPLSDVMAVESPRALPVVRSTPGNAILTVDAGASCGPMLATVRIASFEAVGCSHHGGQRRPCPRRHPSPQRPRRTRALFPAFATPSGDSARPRNRESASCPVDVHWAAPEKFQLVLPPGRITGRSRRRLPRRRRRRLRRQRPAGGPDRQDHRPRAVHGAGHLRRDPAHDRHQARAHHRGDQQGRGCARSSRSPTTAWSETSSRSRPPSSRPSRAARPALDPPRLIRGDTFRSGSQRRTRTSCV